MIIPVRCYTCNKVIGNLWGPYCRLKETGEEERVILEKLGLKRYCCKRMLSTHVNLIDDLLKYEEESIISQTVENY